MEGALVRFLLHEKHHRQKQLRENRAYSLQFTMKRTQGRNLETGTGAEAMEGG